jgi:hypothetical protein
MNYLTKTYLTSDSGIRERPSITQNLAVTLATSLHPLRNKEHNREIKTQTLALSFLLNTSRKKNEKPDGANEQNQHFFLCLSPLWRLWPKTKKKLEDSWKKPFSAARIRLKVKHTAIKRLCGSTPDYKNE